MKKICRNCSYFKYHRFAGYCSLKACDTKDVYGQCTACDSFKPKTNEEAQQLLDYEKNILKK